MARFLHPGFVQPTKSIYCGSLTKPCLMYHEWECTMEAPCCSRRRLSLVWQCDGSINRDWHVHFLCPLTAPAKALGGVRDGHEPTTGHAVVVVARADELLQGNQDAQGPYWIGALCLQGTFLCSVGEPMDLGWITFRFARAGLVL